MRLRHALVGIGLSIILASGCRDDSGGNNDGGSPDLRRDSGPSSTADSPTAIGSCTVKGRTYEVNQAFVDNCITWLCTGADIVQQVSGTVCTDARPADVPAVRRDAGAVQEGLDGRAAEAAIRSDGRGALDEGALRDGPANEAAKRDAQPVIEAGPHLDMGAPDESRLKIDGPPIDAQTAEDAAQPGCTHRGVTYAVGDSFPSDCNTCLCRASAEVVCTTKACALDGAAR